MDEPRPIWVVLSERPARAVERALAKLRIRHVTIVEGSGAYVAIASYEPGSCDGDVLARVTRAWACSGDSCVACSLV